MDILKKIQDILQDLILFWFFFLRCNRSEENLNKYLDSIILPSMGKIIEILVEIFMEMEDNGYFK